MSRVEFVADRVLTVTLGWGLVFEGLGARGYGALMAFRYNPVVYALFLKLLKLWLL